MILALLCRLGLHDWTDDFRRRACKRCPRRERYSWINHRWEVEA